MSLVVTSQRARSERRSLTLSARHDERRPHGDLFSTRSSASARTGLSTAAPRPPVSTVATGTTPPTQTRSIHQRRLTTTSSAATSTTTSAPCASAPTSAGASCGASPSTRRSARSGSTYSTRWHKPRRTSRRCLTPPGQTRDRPSARGPRRHRAAPSRPRAPSTRRPRRERP